MDPITLLVVIGSAAVVGWYALSGDEDKAKPAGGAPAPASTQGPSLPAGPAGPAAKPKPSMSPAAVAAARKKIEEAAASPAGREQIKIGPSLPGGPAGQTAQQIIAAAMASAAARRQVIADAARAAVPLVASPPADDAPPRNPLAGADDLGAIEAGITEPEIVIVSGQNAKRPSAGKSVAETAGATLTGAAIGSETVPVIGTIAGAVVGFFAGIGNAIAAAFGDSDEDRCRYLYEIGVWPLSRAQVSKDVSAQHYAVIQHARILEQAKGDSFGLTQIRSWLTDAKQSSQADPTRHERAQRAYFARLAVAYLAIAQVAAEHGQTPDPIAMPASRALVLRALGRFPVQSALDGYLRAYPATVRAMRRHLAHYPGAWQRLAAWVTRERRRAALRTPDPLAVPLAAPDAKPARLPAGPSRLRLVPRHRSAALPAGPVASAVSRKDS